MNKNFLPAPLPGRFAVSDGKLYVRGKPTIVKLSAVLAVGGTALSVALVYLFAYVGVDFIGYAILLLIGMYVAAVWTAHEWRFDRPARSFSLERLRAEYVDTEHRSARHTACYRTLWLYAGDDKIRLMHVGGSNEDYDVIPEIAEWIEKVARVSGA